MQFRLHYYTVWTHLYFTSPLTHISFESPRYNSIRQAYKFLAKRSHHLATDPHWALFPTVSQTRWHRFPKFLIGQAECFPNIRTHPSTYKHTHPIQDQTQFSLSPIHLNHQKQHMITPLPEPLQAFTGSKKIKPFPIKYSTHRRIDLPDPAHSFTVFPPFMGFLFSFGILIIIWVTKPGLSPQSDPEKQPAEAHSSTTCIVLLW